MLGPSGPGQDQHGPGWVRKLRTETLQNKARSESGRDPFGPGWDLDGRRIAPKGSSSSCLGLSERERSWDVPGILLGCPGRFGAVQKFVLIFQETERRRHVNSRKLSGHWPAETPGGTNGGLPAGVPGISCCLL